MLQLFSVYMREYVSSRQPPKGNFWSEPDFEKEWLDYGIINSRAIPEWHIYVDTVEEIQKTDHSGHNRRATEKAQCKATSLKEYTLKKTRYVSGSQYCSLYSILPHERNFNCPNSSIVTDDMKFIPEKAGFELVRVGNYRRG
jgi:hypothetical protein